jgi:ATP-independent RNA helicase DbpA
MDFAAYVAIDRKSAGQALNRLANGKIKGRKFKVRKLQGQPR